MREFGRPTPIDRTPPQPQIPQETVVFTLNDGVLYKGELVDDNKKLGVRHVDITAASDGSTLFQKWPRPFPLDRRVKLRYAS